jgi:hypothetical protein
VTAPNHQPQAFDGRAFALVGRVAAAALRPLEIIDGTHGALGPLSAAEVRGIAAHPAFGRPVNRAVARSLGLHAAGLKAATLKSFADSAPARLAALLAAQPAAPLSALALVVGAAVLHKRVLRLALKADRQRARAVLTDAGFELATQEAPVLHASLAGLDQGEVAATVFAEGADAGEGQLAVVRLGFDVLGRLVAAVDPALLKLYVLRLPPALGIAVGPALGAADCDQVVKLVRRRLPQWSATIA